MALRADIAAPSRTRGRPKGTGIDDSETVRQIRDMLVSDRALKPTTAIRRLGIADPSIIRRLRDKLSEGAPTPVRATATPAGQLAPEPEKKAGPSPRAPTPMAATAATTEQKEREAALLAAYLQAMQQSQSKPLPDPPSSPRPEAPRQTEPKPEPPKAAPTAAPFANPFAALMQNMSMPAMPTFPGMPPMPGMTANPMQAFSIPGFPSFLQPFQQKQAAPPAGSAQARQLEALKLAIEATTAIAKFQLHLVENAAAYSPMAMMLQGQSFIGQMMIAGLTGQLDVMRRQMTGQAGTEKK